MPMETTPKTTLITGANRGLGLELARAFLAADHQVIATGRSLERLHTALPERPGLLHARLDVTEPETIDAAVAAAIERFGGIDVLVNNAGFAQLGFFEMTSTEDVRRQFDVNVHGPMRVARAVLPPMRAQRSGLLVTLSSSSGLVSAPGGATYSASKFALEGWMEGLAEEIEPFGIRSMVVNPGMLRTDFLDASSVRHGDLPIDDYSTAAEAFRGFIDGANHQQPGDATELARLVVRACAAGEPPRRLLFGDDAVAAAQARVEALEEDLARTAEAEWRASGPVP